MSLPPILNRALKSAYDGANEIIHFSKRIDNVKVINKGINDVTTNIEPFIEEKVFESLKKYYPEFDFFGEESGTDGIEKSDSYWLLDPLDGTRNFIHQYPHYSLSLACVCEGKVVCAVIIDPVRNEVFCAGKDTGALLNNRRIRASKKEGLSNALLSNSSHFNKKHSYKYELLKTFGELGKYNISIRKSGCVSLDLVYVAAGRLDGFWGNGLEKWDRFGGLFIGQAAGCLTTSFDGVPDNFDSDHIIISTPKCFKDLSKCVVSGFQSIE